MNPPPLPPKPLGLLTGKLRTSRRPPPPSPQLPARIPKEEKYEEPREFANLPSGNVREKRQNFEKRGPHDSGSNSLGSCSQVPTTQFQQAQNLQITANVVNFGSLTMSGAAGEQPSPSARSRQEHENLQPSQKSCEATAREQPSPTERSRRYYKKQQPSQKSREASIFIETVNDNTRKHKIDFEEENFQPSCKIVVLNENGKEALKEATDKQKQAYEAPTLNTIHETINAHTESRVIVLGGPGDGKTTTARRYANHVLSKKVPALAGVEMVHFVEVGTLYQKKDTTVFDLLFSQQLGDLIGDSELNAGEIWIRNNHARVLLVLDGLDRIRMDRHGSSKIRSTTCASVYAIIRNLLKGTLFNGMWIMCTSRWQWIWSQPLSELPSRAIELSGYSSDIVMPLLSCLVPSQKGIIKNIFARYPRIADMCKIPKFLQYFARTLSRTECNRRNISQQSVLVNVLYELKCSKKEKPEDANAVYSVIALAYKSLQERKNTFSHAEITQFPNVELDHLEHDDLEHFVDAKPEIGEIHREIFGNFEKCYSFRNDALKVILAAIFIICQDCKTFKRIVSNGMKEDSTEKLQNLVYGIVTDETISEKVVKFAERPIDIKDKQKILNDLLTNRLTSSNVCDLQSSLLLYECKDYFRLPKASLRIDLKDVDQPCDGHAVLEIARKYHFKAVKATKLCIDTSSLNLLGAHRALKVEHLVITGEILLEEIEKFWSLLQNLSGIQTATLLNYSMTYYAQTKDIEVISLMGKDVDVLRKFLHHAAESTKVSIKQFRTTDRTGRDCSELEELERLAGFYKFEIHIVNVGIITRRNVSTIADMLTGKFSCRIGEAKIGLTSLEISIKNDWIERKKTYTLNISGPFTDSRGVGLLMAARQWDRILTKDFDIHIRSQEVIADLRTGDVSSFDTLCEVYQQAFQPKKLTCAGIELFSEMNDNTRKIEVKVGERINVACLAAFLTYIWTSKSVQAHIYFLSLNKNFRFTPEIQLDGSYAMVINKVRGEIVPILEYMLSLVQIELISITDCSINTSEHLKQLRGMSRNTAIVIQRFKVDAKEMDLSSVFHILTLMKVSYSVIRFGMARDQVNVSLEDKKLTMAEIYENSLTEIVEAMHEKLLPGMEIFVEKLVAESENCREHFAKLVQKVASSGAKIIVKRYVEWRSFFEETSCFLDMLEFVRAEEVKTVDARLEIAYSENSKIAKVSIAKATLESYMRIPSAVRMSRYVKIETCDASDAIDFLATIRDKETIDSLEIAHCTRDVKLKLRGAIKRGIVRQIVTVDEGSKIFFLYDPQNQAIVLRASNVDSLQLEKLTSHNEEFCSKFVIENCVVQNRTGNAAEEQVANMKDLPQEVMEQMMAVAKGVSQQSIQKGISALKNLSNKYGNTLELQRLNIEGIINDVKELIALSEEMSIPFVGSKIADISRETKEIIFHDQFFLTLHQANCEVGPEWRFNVPSVALDTMRSMDFERIRRLDITFETIVTSKCLGSATIDFEEILRRVKPTKLITRDYEIRLQFSENGPIKVSGESRNSVDGASIETAARLQTFAERICGYYDPDSTEDSINFETGHTSDKRASEWEWSSDEGAAHEYEIYDTHENSKLATDMNFDEQFCDNNFSYEEMWQETACETDDDSSIYYEATVPKAVYEQENDDSFRASPEEDNIYEI